MSDPEREDREEARVRAAFEALREQDAAAAPSFQTTWAAAASRPRPRPFALWLAAGAGAAATALAGAVALVLWTGAPANEVAADRARAPRSVAADVALATHVAATRPEPLAFASALPTPGAFGGGGWFGSDEARAPREEEWSW